MSETIPVVRLTHVHIGALIETRPVTDDGPLTITGLIRWYTVTSDEVVIAIEEGDEGAVEWSFPADAKLTLIEGEPQ